MADEKLEKLKEIINNSKYLVFFGGAGVSTESGVPDFRSVDGLYNQIEILEWLLEIKKKNHFFYEKNRRVLQVLQR